MGLCNYWARSGFVGIAIMAIAGSSALSAELSEDDADPSGLDEIIVRATRMDKRIDEIPAAISVITKDDIQRGRQQLGLDESLAAIPGVFIQTHTTSRVTCVLQSEVLAPARISAFGA